MLNCEYILNPYFIWQIFKGIGAINTVLLEYDAQGLLPDRDEIIC